MYKNIRVCVWVVKLAQIPRACGVQWPRRVVAAFANPLLLLCQMVVFRVLSFLLYHNLLFILFSSSSFFPSMSLTLSFFLFIKSLALRSIVSPSIIIIYNTTTLVSLYFNYQPTYQNVSQIIHLNIISFFYVINYRN